MPPTETAPRSARDAITAALALAGVSLDPQATGKVMLPSARSRRAVDLLVSAGTAAALQESRPDMKALLSDLLDWDGPKATKAVLRTVAAALLAERPDGASQYPQAVEMLSFASACAPLLEPDRLERLVSHASGTPSAYAPVAYPATLSAALARLIGHYQPARQEQLLCSLWTAAHDGRWWDSTGNLGRPKARRRKRGEAAPEKGERVAAQSRAIAKAFASNGDRVVAELLEGELTWIPPTVERLQAARIPASMLERVGAFATSYHDDPDVAVLCSQLADLATGQRPASPLPLMVETLEFVLGETAPADFMPKKPTEWGALYPKASLAQYPMPDEVLAIDWSQLPGTGTAAIPAALIELIRSPHALFENRDFMGNCTGGYNSRCLAGTTFLGKIHCDGEVFNFSMDRRPPGWYVTQVNGRHNRGQVPAAISGGINAVVAAIVGR